MDMFARWDGELPVLTFTGNASASTATSGLNFGSLSIGAARGDRIVIATFDYFCDPTGPYTPVLTLNGTAMTLVAQTHDTIAFTAGIGTAIFVASVPSGTSATFVGTVGTTNGSNGQIGVWSATSLLSASPTATKADNASISLDLSLSVPAFGISVATANFVRTPNAGSTVWSGAATVRYLYDPVPGTGSYASGADFTQGATGGAVSILVTHSPSDAHCGVAASFR